MTVPLRIAFGLAFVPLGGCDGDDGGGEPQLPACVEIDPAACSPLYAPTFENVFTQTLAPRCGVAGGACHGEAGAEGAVDGGLVLADEAASHAILLDEGSGDGEPFVQPGDAACSLLLVRLLVDDPALRMPPGAAALPENEICSVAQWVDAGAER